MICTLPKSILVDINSKCYRVNTENIQWEIFSWPDQERLHNDDNLAKL